MEALSTVGVNHYLDSYVDSFVEKFNTCFNPVSMGEDTGDYEYHLPLKDSKWLVRFLDMRGARQQVLGPNIYAQDLFLIDDLRNILLVVVLVYNQYAGVLKFIPQSYARYDKKGVFHPSSSIDKLVSEYEEDTTLSMMEDLG
jgi:hypothetical protein